MFPFSPASGNRRCCGREGRGEGEADGRCDVHGVPLIRPAGTFSPTTTIHRVIPSRSWGRRVPAFPTRITNGCPSDSATAPPHAIDRNHHRTDTMTERTIFLAALELAEASERAAYVKQACGEDAAHACPGRGSAHDS